MAPFNGFGKRQPSDRPPVLTPAEQDAAQGAGRGRRCQPRSAGSEPRAASVLAQSEGSRGNGSTDDTRPAADRGRPSRPTEPDGDDALDYLAARLVNGKLTGVPVEQPSTWPGSRRRSGRSSSPSARTRTATGWCSTPARVARAYAELFAGLRVDPAQVLTTTFEANHEELVLVRDIEVMSSLCEHHLLPFHGVAHVGYIPGRDGRITGLSKLARLVEVYARRPQVQERLTSQIADLLMEQARRRAASSSCSSASTCAWRCAASRRPARARSPRRCGASSSATRKSRAEAMSLIMPR